MSTNDIRQKFIKYFESHDHVHVPSSSLVPSSEDRSLLFTNAGMNQFKSLFLGRQDTKWGLLKRAVSYQKCLRAGGKHNDLENVGRDLHHQTFFEMLGNWSFNNAYSEEEACRLAWYFLTDILDIDPARLYVSYFGGSKEWNLPPDENCKRIWLKIGLPESHILPFEKENFWEMGFTGPCGPSSEIFYDRVPGRSDAARLVNIDDSIVELWNIVFISLNRSSTGRLESLPSNHIDTGMGLERLASVMQDVPSNFDIDIFAPIMKHISTFSKAGAYGGRNGSADFNECDASYRIIADHLRGIVVALADGVVPSAVDSGFIVRKMLRRSFWHAVSRLGMDRFACSDLVHVVVDTLRPAYPELHHCAESVAKCVMEEEHQYWNIIDKGCTIFEQLRVKIPENVKVFPGEDAWFLHDTHGIPVEITEDLGRKHGLAVDIKRFEELKEEAKKLSQNTSQFSGSTSIDTTGLENYSDDAKYDYFLEKNGSYSFPQISSKIVAAFDQGERVPSFSSSGSVVLENCQFYAEECGQKSDTGVLEVNEAPVFEVTSVEKVNGVAVLSGKPIGQATISEGTMVKQKIDVKRRLALMRAHSATHLLNWALRRVGAGRGQRGSSIDEDSLRFDYATDDCAGEDDIIEHVESLIANVISEGRDVKVEKTTLGVAAKIRNLQSEFKEGKAYPSVVRVARVGDRLEDALAVECCSGTHVLNTSSIIDFAVMSDRSLAKGVRRMVAVTGEKAQANRRYGEVVESRLESELEELNRGNHVEPSSEEKIEWDRIPYLYNGRCRQLQKSIKKKRKTSKVALGS
nr:Alanyl-tRNA synthetase and Threonyl alanyl tRNA synthetase domain containing protein [Haemonchus contortus]